MVILLFWIFILFVGLSFFGISLQEIVNSPAGQSNLSYIVGLLSQLGHWITTTLQNLITQIKS